MKININRIFSSFLNEYTREDENIQKEKENISEVKEVKTFTSEQQHGGKEATKDIEESPSNADDGKEEKKENKSKGHGGENKKIQAKISEMIKKRSYDFYPETEEEMTEKIIAIIKKALKEQKNVGKIDGYSYYDNTAIAKDMLFRRRYKILHDKYDREETKEALFFLDTSGSLQSVYPSIIASIELLIKEGYIIKVAGAGNGFWNVDAQNDNYNVRETLKKVKNAKIASIARPTIETAAKMANASDISFIVADFDGLSDIVKMSNECLLEKVPYFLCTEGRYSWEDPTEHDWVDPNFCVYSREDRIYDISWYCEEEDYEDEDEYEYEE